MRKDDCLTNKVATLPKITCSSAIRAEKRQRLRKRSSSHQLHDNIPRFIGVLHMLFAPSLSFIIVLVAR